MISVPDADRLLRAHVRPAETVAVPLAEASGRVLRETVVADRDIPPFDRVAMDGIAIAAGDLQNGTRRFRVASTQAAGEAPHAFPEAGTCVEIMTGAALPEGADTVVRYEDLEVEDGWATLRDGVEVAPGQNVHARGSDRRAGAPVLASGVRLGPTHAAALAALGKAEVRVAVPPRVAVVTTGDEVVAVDAPVLSHQIRQSNGPAVHAALALRGYADVVSGHVSDAEVALRARLGEALARADVLVLSGGVSAGRFDLVPSALAALGVREVFHKVRQRPGKPLWFGVAPGGTPVFGLPGNPVSALVCLVRYVVPFLDRAAGLVDAHRPEVHLARLPRRTHDLTLFVPVRLGGAEAHPVPTNGSGDFLALLPSDGFVEVDAAVDNPRPVPFYPWSPT